MQNIDLNFYIKLNLFKFNLINIREIPHEQPVLKFTIGTRYTYFELNWKSVNNKIDNLVHNINTH